MCAEIMRTNLRLLNTLCLCSREVVGLHSTMREVRMDASNSAGQATSQPSLGGCRANNITLEAIFQQNTPFKTLLNPLSQNSVISWNNWPRKLRIE